MVNVAIVSERDALMSQRIDVNFQRFSTPYPEVA